ncbi:MAG: DUF1828 domain-containing protein [Chitinophagales bacterium]
MNWANNLVADYYKWLRNHTLITQGKNGWVTIDTPFVGIFNDTICLFAKKQKGKILLSDDNMTLSNLDLLGVTFKKNTKRYDLLEHILVNYGLELRNDELIIEATESNFTQKKHNFISAILDINNLEVLSKHNVSSIFKEDVREYLDSIDVIYTPEFMSSGAITKLDYTFDFQIAGKNTELVIKSFSMITKPLLSHFFQSWEEIKPVREKTSRKQVNAIAIINDTKNIKSEYLEAITSKEADFVLWSTRDNPENIEKFQKVA